MQDLELLNENVGRTVGGRVEISDDEENDRERIKEGLFGHVVVNSLIIKLFLQYDNKR